MKWNNEDEILDKKGMHKGLGQVNDTNKDLDK